MPLYFIVIYYLTKVFMGKGRLFFFSPHFKRVIFIWLQGATFSLSNHMFQADLPPTPITHPGPSLQPRLHGANQSLLGGQAFPRQDQ